eukprot:CAMPEP_0119049942 /NCGR_PEP_ID=MMETSP1177-20130426/67329_1 /TAXON_ID=2985 /ORGANISM="Ochromonas sp, Strain CCMP1899" /LENGTH=209 /DNA_ID=CAMNT_0007027763 /DNA_START=409 /DNA_END=1038 /DNA_ORIENTATION=+
MKGITVIRSQGFGFAQNCNLNTVSDSDLMASNEEEEDKNIAFSRVLKNMRIQGYRLVTGEEYQSDLNLPSNQRPSIIPLWRPIDEFDSMDYEGHESFVPSIIVSDESRVSIDSKGMTMSLEDIVVPQIIGSSPNPKEAFSEGCQERLVIEVEESDTLSTVSPAGKRIRCGTTGNAAYTGNHKNDEDLTLTDSSNAVTVPWAVPDPYYQH